MNFVIACGGTGGHLFPGLAVAEVLRGRGHRLLILISEKEVDALAVRAHALSGDYRFEKLPSIGLPRWWSPAMAGFVAGFTRSVAACRRLYQEFRPDAVLAMGGFTSTPPLLAGRLRGTPGFVHESNAIPGKANLLNARLADTVLLGFAECADHFPRAARRVVTGTPVRASLRRKVSRSEALTRFGFAADPAAPASARQTVLVMGGSQGARGVNQAVTRALAAWESLPLRIIHLTGRDDEETVRSAYAGRGFPHHVAAFCHEMEWAYAAADLVVARSGAASLSELASFGLPSVLVPYPHAAGDHQTRNAEIFVRRGAAVLWTEQPLAATGPSDLALIVAEVLADRPRLETMAAAARQLAPTDAAERVAAAVGG